MQLITPSGYFRGARALLRSRRPHPMPPTNPAEPNRPSQTLILQPGWVLGWPAARPIADLLDIRSPGSVMKKCAHVHFKRLRVETRVKGGMSRGPTPLSGEGGFLPHDRPPRADPGVGAVERTR